MKVYKIKTEPKTYANLAQDEAYAFRTPKNSYLAYRDGSALEWTSDEVTVLQEFDLENISKEYFLNNLGMPPKSITVNF